MSAKKVLNGFKQLWGVGVYLLVISLLVEMATMYTRQWVSFPFHVAFSVQVTLTVILGVLFIAGMIWFNTTLNLIKVNLLDDERTLVTHGPFNYVRHPLYANILLTAVPLTIVWYADGLFAISWIVILLIGHALVLKEERGLLQEFGDAYTSYRKYVPALVPYKGNGGKRYHASCAH